MLRKFYFKILLILLLSEEIGEGLDYSDVNFASAKFRAAAKIENTSTAMCLFLVKNLGNFTKKRKIYAVGMIHLG